MPGNQCDEPATRTGWTWLPASAAAQIEEVPKTQKERVRNKQFCGGISAMRKISPYRALKLGSFASATLYNIIDTNISGAELFLAPSRDTALLSVATAVAIDARAVRVAEEGIGRVALDRTRAALFAAHGATATGAIDPRRLASLAR